MGTILFLILFFLILKNPSDQRNSDIARFFIGAIAVMTFLSIFLESPFGILALLGIGAYVFYRIKVKKDVRTWKDLLRRRGQRSDYENMKDQWREVEEEARRRAEKQQEAQRRADAAYRDRQWKQEKSTSYGNGQSANQHRVKSNKLPASVSKRRKIVKKFNEKYNLYLTDAQITSIVNSSYMSETWKKELEDMDEKYEIVHEWFQGPTKWLRVYMYVFHVQEITSDIYQQEEICKYSFESIFQYMDTLPDLPMDEIINMINRQYFTSFDSVSFMIAYRFLESQGLYHDLKKPDLMSADPEDDLTEKYL